MKPKMPLPTVSSFLALVMMGCAASNLPAATHCITNATLPGAINRVFVDGHLETVRLENLWQVYWHQKYVPPAAWPRWSMSQQLNNLASGNSRS